MRALVGLLALGLLAGCAHRPPPAPAAIIAVEPANARVKLYAACAGAAERAGTVERYGRYIRLNCAGLTAQSLYEAAEVYARARGQEATAGARTTRYFSDRTWDDQCWTEAQVYGCRIHLPVGAFLDPEKDLAPPPKKK